MTQRRLPSLSEHFPRSGSQLAYAFGAKADRVRGGEGPRRANTGARIESSDTSNCAVEEQCGWRVVVISAESCRAVRIP